MSCQFLGFSAFKYWCKIFIEEGSNILQGLSSRCIALWGDPFTAAWWITNLSSMNSPLSFGTLPHSFIDSMPKMVTVMLPFVVHLVKIPEFELEPSLLGSCRRVRLPGGLWKSPIWPGHSWVSSSSWVLCSLMMEGVNVSWVVSRCRKKCTRQYSLYV